ncbi:hypothetical protein VPH35_105329 [Triticum aestivum]
MTQHHAMRGGLARSFFAPAARAAAPCCPSPLLLRRALPSVPPAAARRPPLPSPLPPPSIAGKIIKMDEVTQAVENLKSEWSQAVAQLEVCIAAIESCGKMGKGTEEAMSLPRLNGSAQDALQLLNALQCRLDLLAEQLPTFEEVQSGQATLGSWKEQYQRLRATLRSANLQAKVNIGKAAQEERELLLGGGEESTIRRRNLQTKAGMTSAAESITESLRMSRQLMVQEVERSANTLSTFGKFSCD